MSGYNLSCTREGYLVTFQYPVKLAEVLRELYGTLWPTHYVKLRDVLFQLNPQYGHLLSSEENYIPINATLVLPSKDALTITAQDMDRVRSASARRAMDSIFTHIDSTEELRGAGIELVLPSSDPITLRQPTRKDGGLSTWVRIIVPLSEVGQQAKSLWQTYKGAFINCGAMFGSGVGAILSCSATKFTAGASLPVCVTMWTGTVASGAQCGLALSKSWSPAFEEYLKTDDGQWVNYVDIGLDILSLGAAAATLPSALKSGSKLLEASKYYRYMSQVDKGKLIKTMTRIEAIHEEMANLRKMFEVGLKISNPAGKTTLTNNIVKRMMPLVFKELSRQKIAHLSGMIATALTGLASSEGGIGDESWGVIRNVSIEIYQFLEP